MEPGFGRGRVWQKAGFQIARDRAGVWNDDLMDMIAR